MQLPALRRLLHTNAGVHVLQAWSFVLLVCATLFGLTAWRTDQAYDLQLHAAQITTANLARSLADRAHSTINSTATILSSIVERLENDQASDAGSPRLHRLLLDFVARKQSLSDIVIFSADGDGLATTLEPMPKVNVSDRNYFIYHRDHPDRTPRIGTPFRNRGEGRWSVPVSRRVDNPDGSFGGVVVALIDCETVSRFYRDFDVGPHGTIWLMNEDAMVLVRQPPIPGTIGQNFAQSPFVQDYYEHGPTGSGEHLSLIDGTVRLGSYRKVDDYPLVVFVTVSKDDILTLWRSEAKTAWAVAVILSAALGILGWRLARQFQLRDQSDIAIRHSEQQYRLLADHSTDVIIQFTADGRRHYVSPAAERVLGYHPQELINGHPRETVHPDDWPYVAAAMETIRTTGYASPLSYRIRRKDGVYIWVETQGRKLDKQDGFIVAIRDISTRKRIEKLLQEANAQMQQTILKDTLTGVTTRLGLDRILEKERRRAARHQTPVALLMIDVDGLKDFNDRYGYSAGDACLAAIAGAIGQQLRRPADIVARYAGEEFAVVLPDTDAQGAATKAEQIRAAVQGLDIVHAGASAGVVTVSVGVGVTWPQTGEKSEQTLVQMANAALHQAKARSHNSICAKAATAAVAAGLAIPRSA